MQPHNMILGHGKQAKGVVVAQVLLFCKGQTPHIVQGLDVVRSDAHFRKALGVERHRSVHAGAEIAQTAQLQRLQILARQGFLLHIKKHGPLLGLLTVTQKKLRRGRTGPASDAGFTA